MLGMVVKGLYKKSKVMVWVCLEEERSFDVALGLRQGG